jgi:hypothetical protein
MNRKNWRKKNEFLIALIFTIYALVMCIRISDTKPEYARILMFFAGIFFSGAIMIFVSLIIEWKKKNVELLNNEQKVQECDATGVQ